MNIPAQEVKLQVPKTRLTVTVRNEMDGYGPANMQTVVDALKSLFKYVVVVHSHWGGNYQSETDQIEIMPPTGIDEETFEKVAEARGFVRRYNSSRAQFIEDLRRLTGSGLIDCRDAAEKSGWDMRLAISFLSTKGLAYHIKRS